MKFDIEIIYHSTQQGRGRPNPYTHHIMYLIYKVWVNMYFIHLIVK